VPVTTLYDVTITVELGLSAATTEFGLWDVGLWDEALWGPDVLYEDVSTYLRSIRTDRRFSRGLQQWQGGNASVVLNNRDGRFSAANLSGPYVAAGETQIRPLLPIRISAAYNSTTYTVYAGYVDSWTESWSGGAPGSGDAITTLDCSDEWSDLAVVDGIEVTPVGGGELSGLRIHRILDAAMSTAARDIDSGVVTVQDTDLSDSTTSELEKTVEAEGGGLWIEDDGTITYASRNGLVEQDRSVTAQATFADDGTGESYAAAQVAYDGELVVNYASYTREGGTAQVATSEASRARYRERRVVKTGLICESDAQALSLAQWEILQYSEPEYRFTSLTVYPRRNAETLFPQVLGRRVRDMIRIVRTPPGGYTIDRRCHIAGISHQIDINNWQTTWQLWSAELYAQFALSRWDEGEWDTALWSF
jgi:hypothetical protein